MALPQDLLVQARQLATKEPKRPKQASLRRAVSAAYYALFHLLVDQACRFLISGQSTARIHLREQLARSFNHGHMKKVSQSFGGGAGAPWLAQGTKPTPALVHVANAFVDLQQARHDADYNLQRTFTRTETLAFVGQAKAAFSDWQTIRTYPEAEAYLVALLVAARK